MECTSSLVQSLGWSHRRLDVQRTNVLPVLLQQRHQEIDGQMHVLDELVLGHANVADGNGQAQNLLHLELDGGLDLIDLGVHRFAVRQQTGELASLVQTGTQQTGNLLDQRLGGEEGVVLLGQLLHQLLVLVQLLEGLGVHMGMAGGGCLVAMLLVAENANLHLGTGDVLEPDGKKNRGVSCGWGKWEECESVDEVVMELTIGSHPIVQNKVGKWIGN